jgi:hypothetical protein
MTTVEIRCWARRSLEEDHRQRMLAMDHQEPRRASTIEQRHSTNVVSHQFSSRLTPMLNHLKSLDHDQEASTSCRNSSNHGIEMLLAVTVGMPDSSQDLDLHQMEPPCLSSTSVARTSFAGLTNTRKRDFVQPQ